MFRNRQKILSHCTVEIFLREDYEWLADALEEADISGDVGRDYPDLGVGVEVSYY